MQYLCKTEGGRFLAVIEDENGKRLDQAEGFSKFAAMEMRDRARSAGIAAFAHIDNPPTAPAPTPEPEAEVKAEVKATAKRVRKARAKPTPEPEPVAAKPKRTRKRKAAA